MSSLARAPSPPAVGPRAQDVAVANHQIDNDYSTLAGRGVKVIEQSRAGSGTASRQKHSSALPATAEDIKLCAQVRDLKSVPAGTIAIGIVHGALGSSLRQADQRREDC
jgi:hypothetical protein